MALTISSDRNMAVTGQVGAIPVAFLWDSRTGEMKQRF
jgi:hypothetical protein